MRTVSTPQRRLDSRFVHTTDFASMMDGQQRQPKGEFESLFSSINLVAQSCSSGVSKRSSSHAAQLLQHKERAIANKRIQQQEEVMLHEAMVRSRKAKNNSGKKDRSSLGSVVLSLHAQDDRIHTTSSSQRLKTQQRRQQRQAIKKQKAKKQVSVQKKTKKKSKY